MAIQNHSKRPAYVAQRMDKLVKKRTGVTRHSTELFICGLKVKCLTTSPETLHECWYHKPQGRHWHFAVVRFSFQSEDGRLWTAKRAQTHDADHGYCLSITGFYDLKPAEIGLLQK